MSGIVLPPRGRAKVSVSQLDRPPVMAITVPGQQGATGRQGERGPPGPLNNGFGTVDYSDRDAGVPLQIPAGQWVRMIRNLAPSASNANPPAGPWTGFQFWRDGALRARAEGDLIALKFSYVVVPEQRGSAIRFGLWPGGMSEFDFGPGPIMISSDAGQEERSSATFIQNVRSRFVTWGAEVHIWSSAGATLLEFSPEITPQGYVSASA